MNLPKEHRRAAVELLLGAAAGRIDRSMLAKSAVADDLAQAMVAAGLLRDYPLAPTHWDLTPAAHRFVNTVIADAQHLLP